MFAQKGFEATSLSEVGAAAGVSRGTPGYFFGSKAELYHAVLERSFAEVREAIREGRARAMASGQTPEAILAGAVSDYFGFLAARPNFIRLIEREAVFYWNQGRARPPVTGLPEMQNEVAFAEAVTFLASGETIITNSYHGAFWGTLLGRKVVVVDAYSSKLHCLKFAPAIADGVDWRSARPAAHPGALADARRATSDFRVRVMEILGR